MCEIRVIQIFALLDSAGQITALIVDGTTTDCNQLDVSVEHTGSAISIPTKRFTANAAGQWRATFEVAANDFRANDFACGHIAQGSVRAKAVCVTDATCHQTREFKVLDCGTSLPPLPPPSAQPVQPCPSTSITPPVVSSDCVNGQRRVEISGVVTPEPNTIVSARLVLNDASGQTVAVIDEAFSQTSTFSLGGAANALDVSPGEYTARLEVTRPNYCGANTEPVSVPACASRPDIPRRPDTPRVPDPPAPTPPSNSLCWLWFWINVGLFTLTGILIFVTLCLIEANVWTAIAALGSGGALAAVWLALSALNIGMLIASVALVLLTLASFSLWLGICAFGRMRNNICDVLALLMSILAGLNSIALVVAIALSLLGILGCALGAWINVAWFSLLMSITWFAGQLLGCFPIGFMRASRIR